VGSARGVVRFLGLRRWLRVVSAARSASSQSASRPNKRMHATRDTLPLIYLKRAGGRVMRGVSRLLEL